MGLIIFNGRRSSDYNILVEHPPGYEAAERDYDAIHVPGRNGDVYMDKSSYKNVSRVYEIASGSTDGKFAVLANNISEWLQTARGYARLEDTYEPEYYRLAIYVGALNVQNILQHAGRAQVSFNCKPQRFLKSGEKAVDFSGGGTIYNPTGFVSLPVITVEGNGKVVLNVNDYVTTITFRSEVQSLTMDSAIQDVFCGTINMNSAVKMEKGFPKLEPGENIISYTGTVSKLEVVPNWWTI